MNPSDNFLVGTCTYGPVILSSSISDEMKHSIAIINYDGTKHYNLVTCKTTSKNHDKLYPGEFLLGDLFGKGPSKVQPYNIIRIPKTKIPHHTHLGRLAVTDLQQFKLGLQLAIKGKLLDAKESLDLADSWRNLFTFPES